MKFILFTALTLLLISCATTDSSQTEINNKVDKLQKQAWFQRVHFGK